MQIPFCVVVGWFMGQPMDLNFKLFETATLFITVLVVAFMLQVSPCLSFTNFMVFMLIFVVVSDAYIYIYQSEILLFCALGLLIQLVIIGFYWMQEGTSNYFKGLMLILCYLIVAASFFVHVDPTNGQSHIFPQMRERILSFP